MARKPTAQPPETAGASPASAARRKFLNGIAAAAGGGVLLTAASWLAVRPASANPALALRPPGALGEAAFLSACVRCGLCVRDCPYDTLKLAPQGDGVAPGTPFFTARDVPCEMCDDIPCVKACPTGALNPKLTDIQQAEMGLAVLSDHESCLNFLGLRCDVCYRVCPVIDKAITLEKLHNPRSDRHALLLPTVHSEHCTGCGKCEKACVLPEAAIKVMPVKLARGALPEHYRKGWEEKEKHGGSLIGEQLELPVRGLEDKAYGDVRVAAPPLDAPSAPSGMNSRWQP
ncbi:MAG: ferredoxin-type protein NapG [Azonexaceae bacterium]|uniref:ferredoxin-type protein NapG n=1 Tax=Azonexus sp. R2A61 TaxID=2744443 RepID=UPI001F386F22|nr:ferredoxin-type protein NapG [Azonexus sp. R2A61]MCE1239650.1 ferredoxin-type protein NapG [Azonexaceae bacterium]